MLREWLPQAEALVVPEATHGLPFMNPHGLAEGLTAFFARHPLKSQTRQREDAVARQDRTTEQRPVPSGSNGAGATTTLLARQAAQPASQEALPEPNHAPDAPVKLVALYGPPTDAEAFERHYAETHTPLAHQLPGLRWVETALILGTAQGGIAPYYRIAELWFEDIAQLQAAAVSAEGQALAADVANFATGGVTVLVARADQSGVTAIAGT
jgi:uncharacterized protein (TIGR02118 family)